MTRSFMKTINSLIAAGILASCLVPMPAEGQVYVDVGLAPPPEFIATATPVYYEGRPAYWWNGRWYFRDGARWGYWHDEPGYLHDWRGHHEPARVYYGRAGGGYRGGGGGFHRR